MKWGKGIAVLLVLLIASGLVCHVPIARAGARDKTFSGWAYLTRYTQLGHVYYTFIVGTNPGNWSGISASSQTVTVDGVVRTNAGYGVHYDGSSWADSMSMSVPAWTDGSGSHSISWTMSADIYQGVATWSGSWSGTLPAVDGQVTPPVPVSVALSGPNLVVPSLGFLYTATISGGTTPYAVQFSKMKSGGTSYWYYDAVNTSSTVVQQYISFDQVGTYTARVVVIDGESTSVQDTMTVTVVERKPDLWGVVLIEGGELQFALSGAEGGAKPEWGYGVYYPTSVYTVKAPSWRAREGDHYTLDLDPPYPNPLVVAVRYTDPSTGSAWDYQFTFDMTDVDEEDEWIDSNGVGEVSLVDTLPEWLKALLDGIRDVFEKMFRWLFVPTSQQVSDLLPSGSLGASLLDGVAWTGAEAGEYTLHGHWTVNGSEVEVPLVSFNVSSVAASPFVGVVRKIVQAGVCLALVYMVVVLV